MATKGAQQRTQKGQNVLDMNDEQAREYFERMRWPNGPVCVHCQSTNVYRLQGKAHRAGLLECKDCRKQFTVTVGTVMEDSHLPLATWAKAFHLVCSSKKGISALQLQRNLGLGSYRTAWFMAHRIREAMKCEPVAGLLKDSVQVDETFVGGKPRTARRGKQGLTTKKPVIVMVESDGQAVCHPIESTSTKSLGAAMDVAIDPTAKIVTDEWPAYRRAAAKYAGHETVCHSADEYVNERGFHTNTAEGFFSLLKRGVYGTFHHVSHKHLHRYCDEFAFRWNGRRMTDTERRDAAVRGSEGKRLMYKAPVN